MQLLIDADYTCYQSVASAEVEIEWDEDTYTIYGDLEKAKDIFRKHLHKYFEDTQVFDYQLCWTGGTNYRKLLNPEYKGGRKRKPVGYGALKSWAISEFPSFLKEGLEADDCMGILATKFKGKTIIVTVDKDLLTIPGKMYRLSPSGKHEWHETSEEEANFRFLSQALSGDKTDGYDGIPGMGKVKADALLKKKGAVYKTVEDAYLEAGMTKEDALMNTRMARILQDTDWDSEKQEVKLWTPNVPA